MELLELKAWRLHAEKKPIDEHGVLNRSSDILTDAAKAIKSFKRCTRATGVALEFGSDGLCGIDLDGCRDPNTGEFEPWAKEIIKKFRSYAEVSMSGTGAKILFLDDRANSEGYKQPWTQINVPAKRVVDKTPAIECYIGGTRYFCMTGDRLAGMHDLIDCSAAVDWLFHKYQRREAKEPKEPLQAPRYSQINDYDLQLKRCNEAVAAIPGASKGNRDGMLWRVATVCYGFDLNEDESREVMLQWNERCDPPQKGIARRIDHKLKQLSSCNLERGRFVVENVSPSQVCEILEETDCPFTYIRKSELYKDLREKVKDGYFDTQPSGIYALDDVLDGGIPRHGVMAIMGRPSHGKTAIMLHCLRVLARHGKQCLFITKEMSVDELIAREICMVEPSPRNEWRHRADAIFDKLEQSSPDDILYVDSCGDLADIEKCIRYAVRNDNVDVVAIDYLQRIPVKGAESEYERVSAASMRLANLARELGITMYLACQMNRQRENYGKPRPVVMSDARGSGQIEQDVDIMIHVEWPCLDDDSIDPADFRITILKCRSIKPQVRSFIIEWDAERQFFEPMPLASKTEAEVDNESTKEEEVQERDKKYQRALSL